MTRHRWTPADIAVLRARYPDDPTVDVAAALGLPARKVYAKANDLGLKKSAAFHASARSGRIMRGRTDPRMIATQFRKGMTPANKGLRRPGWAPGRMAETQFKKGRPACEARNYKPIGSLRVSKDGILERKVTDDPSLYPARRWVSVARLVWEAAHGPLPPKHVVRFRVGMATTDPDEITLDRIECISMRENMRRNTVHRLPKELAQVVQLRGALIRSINRARRDAESAP